MAQYIRKLKDIPGFSDIPLPGHGTVSVVDKILIDPVTGSRNFMLLWAKIEPGSQAEPHSHPVEQAYFVLSGQLKLHIAGQEYTAEANSSVLFPAGVEHTAVPVGEEPVTMLIMFAPPVESFKNRPH